MKDWKKVKLGTLLTESKIVSENPNPNNRIRVKLNVLGVEKRPVTKDKKGATKYYTRKTGQFVYGKQNLHKGAFGIIPEELDGFESSLDIPAFDVDELCYPEWIFYFFKKGNFYLKLESIAKGVGSKRIHPKQIFMLDIFLPSKEEQKEVLDEIEKAELINQELVTEIEFQEENLIKLRQTILKDAVQGKLSQDWRAINPNIASAEALLKKIKAEKEQLIKEKKVKKEETLPLISPDDLPFDIPKSWEWTRFGNYIKTERGRFSARPRNDPKYFNGAYPFIQIGNIPKDWGRITNHNQTLNEDGLKVSKLFPKETIVIAIVGATIGNSGILGYEMCFPDSIIGIKPSDNFDTHYIYIFLQQRKMDFRNEAYSGGGQPNIKLTTLNEVLLPVPPLKEQLIIREKVEELIAHCNDLHYEIQTRKAHVILLIQSSLNKFLGDENNILVNKKSAEEEKNISSRGKKYNSKTLLMDLVNLLKVNGKLHAEDLWKMSEYPNDIDAFYAELKEQIEEKKTIKESEEKGYLELV